MNEAVTVINALPMYSGAFSITLPLGIDRGNYIALHSSIPRPLPSLPPTTWDFIFCMSMVKAVTTLPRTVLIRTPSYTAAASMESRSHFVRAKEGGRPFSG